MASRLGITGPVAIYPAGLQSACTLKNVGDNDIYVDSQSIPVGIPAGFPLGKGSSMVWDAERPLFASSPLGSELLISENSGNLFDAQAIAAEITAGNLAQEIAQQVSLYGAPQSQRTLWDGGPQNYAAGGTYHFDMVPGGASFIFQVWVGPGSAQGDNPVSRSGEIYFDLYGSGRGMGPNFSFVGYEGEGPYTFMIPAQNYPTPGIYLTIPTGVASLDIQSGHTTFHVDKPTMIQPPGRSSYQLPGGFNFIPNPFQVGKVALIQPAGPISTAPAYFTLPNLPGGQYVLEIRSTLANVNCQLSMARSLAYNRAAYTIGTYTATGKYDIVLPDDGWWYIRLASTATTGNVVILIYPK